jgi:hypothetical protein
MAGGYRAAMRPRTLALAIAAVGGSAVAIALARLKRPEIRLRRRAQQPDTYRCACGQGFRVTGSGRHRVYWLEGAAQDDPVLSQHCPACDRSLV